MTESIQNRRYNQPYSHHEIQRALVLLEKRTFKEVAAILQRSEYGLHKVILNKEGVRFSQRRNTATSIARDTGYHFSTIRKVARKLSAGRATTGKQKKYITDDEVERITEWLKTHSLMDRKGTKGARRARQKILQCWEKHPTRTEFQIGQRIGKGQGGSVVLKIERRGSVGRPLAVRLYLQRQCDCNHVWWSTLPQIRASAKNTGRCKSCVTKLNFKRKRKRTCPRTGSSSAKVKVDSTLIISPMIAMTKIVNSIHDASSVRTRAVTI